MTTDIRYGLQVQQGIESAMNSLVRRAQKLVDRTEIQNSNLEKHQLSNLLDVALDTLSAEVVVNFILYQVGRDTTRISWRYQNFGQELARELDKLRNDVAKVIARRIKKRPSDREIDEIWIQLVRQYIGQLNRYFYYRKETMERRGP